MADNDQNLQDIRFVNRALENQIFYTDIVSKYQERIIRYVIRISGISYQEAEDVAQEVFLKAYVNLNNFNQEKKFFSWLFSIAHNEIVSYWRKNKKRLKDISIEGEELAEKLGADFKMIEKIDSANNKDFVKQAISKLDFKYREVLQLKYIDDYSYEEISDIIKKPTATVGTLISRAKKILKNDLDKKYYE